jgi:glycine cleavage system H protein
MAVNQALSDDPEKINADPYGDGWIVRIRPEGEFDEGDLLTPDEYQAVLDELDA